jgi:hypothetical protein
MLTTFDKLRRAQLLTIPGLLHLVEAVQASGLNLMALLRIAARAHPERVAIVDDRERLRYGELWRQAEGTAVALQEGYGVQAGQRVAIACRNHAAAIKAIVAGSRLGAHVFLVNPELSGDQIRSLDARLRFDLFVYDEELAPLIAGSSLGRRALPSYHQIDASIDGLAAQYARTSQRLQQANAGTIVVMTGGTTGQPKAAGRTPSVLNSLPPLLALLARAHLDAYHYAWRVVTRNPRRTGTYLFGLALAVGLFAGILFFVDVTARQMTETALAPITLGLVAHATTPEVDVAPIAAAEAGQRCARCQAAVHLPGAARRGAGGLPGPVRRGAVCRGPAP